MTVNIRYLQDEKEDKRWDCSEEQLQKSFACALRVLRKYKRLSLQSVGESTDIPFQTVARYESGENVPSVVQALKLAHFYEISLNEMFVLGNIKDIEEDYEEILNNRQLLEEY